jgi:arylsulfatase A-like enzyme
MRAYHWNLEILSSVTALSKRRTKRAAAAAALLGALALATLAIACFSDPRPAGGGAAPSSGSPGGGARRNLIVVVVDTLRRDHLSLYGYGKPTSPGLVEFAKSAIRFERASAASSWTEPSTASLLSGLTPPRHGAHEYARIPASVTMLAEVLHDAGYRTGAVSGNPNASPLFGFDQGFDSFYFPGNDEARDYPDVSELVAKARDFIKAGAHDAARPFFCYLHVMNVHGPYLAPPEFRERFLERPFEEFPFQNDLWKEILRKGHVERRKEVTPEKLRDLTARYDGAIAYTDSLLSSFLNERLAAGGDKNDLIVVTADHGEELFDHGGFGHGFTLHHEVVDVPLLLRLPGGEGGGTRIDAPVSLVDVAPTLLDLLGLLDEQPGRRFGDGVSLVPLFSGAPVERETPIVAELLREKQGEAFLIEQWPLRTIVTAHDYAGRRDVVELYDEAADPQELHDLAAADPARAADLRRAAAARRAALEAGAFASTREELDEAARRKMKALGY